MYKSCVVCGKPHKLSEGCTNVSINKNHYRKRETKLDKFRSSGEWQDKRKQIKQRDKYLCQLCLRKLHNTIARQYNSKDLQVHHIIPMSEDFNRRLDDDNLITLCEYHHKMAERGKILKSELLNLVSNPP